MDSINLYLVEVCELCDLVPEVCHDLLVLGELGVVPLALALDDGVAHGQALEVVLVQEAVVIDVVHEPHHELHPVVPAVGHFDCGRDKS